MWANDSPATARDHGRGAFVADERVGDVKTESALVVVLLIFAWSESGRESAADQRRNRRKWHHESRRDREPVQYRRP